MTHFLLNNIQKTFDILFEYDYIISNNVLAKIENLPRRSDVVRHGSPVSNCFL